MKYTIPLSLAYALHLIATGLLRCIEAQAYKPNALWFCLVTAVLIIAGAWISQLGKKCIGTIVMGSITLLVLAFYAFSFLSAPEKDANLRVGAIILTSIAHLLLLFFPQKAKKSQ